MSDIRMLWMGFTIIGTCAQSRDVRAGAWVLSTVCMTVMIAVWVLSAAFGIEV